MDRDDEMRYAKSGSKTPIYLKGYDKFLNRAGDFLSDNLMNTRHSILYVDFNGFQMVNDIYGFTEGDRLLSAFEQFLCRLPGIVMCAHILADNYLCLFEVERTRDIAQEINEMERSMDCFLENQRMFHPNCKITANGGFCVIVNGENYLTEAVDNANTARKHSKQTGRVCITWFDANMRNHIRHHKEISAAVQAALRDEEFTFYLQPKVSLQTGRLTGAEVLARWRRSDGSIIPPDEFIPLMEKDHSIVELDFLIYRKAFEMIEQRRQMDLPIVTLSLNVSRVHLDTPNVAERIYALASAYGVHPSLLEFEMTETMYVNNYVEMDRTVRKMHEYGYKVSIDDFGTGYSSLNMLQELSFDVLKLDKKFVVDSERYDRRNQIITTQIIEMANKLHISVLCEGVETLAQAEYLHRIGCDTAQGYYFDKPLPCDAFNEKQAQFPYYDLPWAKRDSDYQEINAMPDKEMRAITNSVFDVIQGAVVGLDRETYHVLFANNQLFELVGYSRTELDFEHDENWMEHFVDPSTAHTILQMIESQFHAGGNDEFEFPIHHKDGRIRWLRMRGGQAYSPVHGQYLLCTFFDISSEREAERMDCNLQMLMDSLHSGILRLSFEPGGLNIEIEIASDSFYRLCNMEGHSTSPRLFDTLLNDAARNQLWMIAQGGATQMECLITLPNDNKIWLRLFGNHALHGQDGRWRLDCIISDISQEKQQQQEISQQCSRLSAFYGEVYSNSPCGMIQYTADHSRCISLNPYAARLLGIQDVQKFCSRKSAAILHYIHKQDWDRVKGLVMDPDRKCGSYELRIVPPNGQIRWLTGTSKKITDANGRDIVLYTFVDSTESNRIKQKFMRYNKRIAALLKAVIFEYSFAEDTLYFYQTENSNTILPTHIANYRTRILNGENAPFQNGQQLLLELPSDTTILRNKIIKRDLSSGESWLSCSLYFERDKQGKPLTVIGYYRDVTLEQRARLQQNRRARLDQLTGVCTRDTFESLCVEHLDHVSRSQISALFLLKLNEFRVGEQEQNLQFSEAVLERIGALLLRDFHRGDIVGRVEDNCYGALLSGEVSMDIARARAAKICSSVEQLFRTLKFASGSCSIGIAYGHLTRYPLSDVLETAATALYEAKEMGGNSFRFKIVKDDAEWKLP